MDYLEIFWVAVLILFIFAGLRLTIEPDEMRHIMTPPKPEPVPPQEQTKIDEDMHLAEIRPPAREAADFSHT